jgi:hypothetical protein
MIAKLQKFYNTPKILYKYNHTNYIENTHRIARGYKLVPLELNEPVPSNRVITPVDDQIWRVWKNQTIRFPISEHPILAFSGKTKKGAKLKDLKIQGVLRHEKGLTRIKKPAEATKTELSSFGYRSIRFFQNR